MADDVQISTGLGATAYISADDASGRLIQRVKLVMSADGVATHIPADANGLLVNLGTNNDVVASGTVAVSGTATVSVAGTAAVAATLAASTAYTGAVSAGTAYMGVTAIGTSSTVLATMHSLTSSTAVGVAMVDNTGTQVSFAAPILIAVTSTNGTAVYASGDTMGTALAFSSATVASGATGHVVGARVFVTSDVSSQNLRLWLFDSSVTPSADNAVFNITVSDIVKTQGIISFQDWYDGGTAHVSVGRLTPMGHPIAYNTSGSTTLYGVLESRGTGTYATATVSVELAVLRD